MKVLLWLVTASYAAGFIRSASIVGWIPSKKLEHSATSLFDLYTRPFSRHLLLFSEESSSSSSSSSTIAATALCLEGGGFLAVAVHTGLVTGLLRAAAKKHDGNYDLEESKLLSRIKVIVSNSGGSWFASQLMYSDDFVTLVEKMAKESTAAPVEKLFKDNYTQKWINEIKSKPKSYFGEKLPSLDKDIQQFGEKLPLPIFGMLTQQLINSLSVDFTGTELAMDGWLQDWKMILYLYHLEGGLTWQNFVERLLSSTSSINSTHTLGSDVKGWCKGKTWVINTSSVTPFKGSSYKIWEKGTLPLDVAAQKTLPVARTEEVNIAPHDIAPYVEYSTRLEGQNNNRTPLIPSRLSVVLGGVASGNSPLPVAASELLKYPELSYKGKTSWAPGMGIINARAPQRGIGEPQPQAHLPLISAVACSSAFLGGLPSTLLGSKVAAELKGDFAMWFAANQPAAEAFGTARNMVDKLREMQAVSQEDLDRIAKAGVYGIIDGGFTENTGIINAVAAGATELYVWLDRNANDAFDPSLLNLFHGGTPIAPRTELSKIMGDSFFFQIFSMPMADAKSKVEKFKRLNYPNIPNNHIADFRVGTIETTTVENRIVGIKKDIRITLHVMIVASSLSIGFGENFNDYAALVGQISQALELESNKDIVNDMLESLVDGSATFPET